MKKSSAVLEFNKEEFVALRNAILNCPIFLDINRALLIKIDKELFG